MRGVIMPSMKKDNNVKVKSAMRIDGAFGLSNGDRLTYTANGDGNPQMSPQIVEYEQYGKYVWAKDVHGIVYTNSEDMYRQAIEEAKKNMADIRREQYQESRPQANELAAKSVEKQIQAWRDFNASHKDLTPRKMITLENARFVCEGRAGRNPISIDTLEMLHNAPTSALRGTGPAYAVDEQAMGDYLRSRGKTEEDWNYAVNTHNITREDLERGLKVSAQVTYYHPDLRTVNNGEVSIPHIQHMSINPDTGDLSICSRSMNFISGAQLSRELAHNIGMNFAHIELEKRNAYQRRIEGQDPEQARLDSFSRNKDAGRRTIAFVHTDSYKPTFNLITHQGMRYDNMDARVLNALCAPNRIGQAQFEQRENNEYNQRAWQDALARVGADNNYCMNLMEQLGINSMQDLNLCRIEVTGLVQDDEGRFSQETFEVGANHFYLDRATGEFSVNSLDTTFLGRDRELADMPNLWHDLEQTVDGRMAEWEQDQDIGRSFGGE